MANVVLPPDTQVMVPPTANAAALAGVEAPPVLTAVHPLSVMVLEAFPEMVEHVMDPVAPAVSAIPNVSPDIGMTSTATVNRIRLVIPPIH